MPKRVLYDEKRPQGLIVFHDEETNTLGAFRRVHASSVAAVTDASDLCHAFALTLLHLLNTERAAEVSPDGPTDEASPDKARPPSTPTEGKGQA